MKKTVLKTAVFFCSLAVLLFSLVWLTYEIIYCSCYQKVPVQVSSITYVGHPHMIIDEVYGSLKEYKIELSYTLNGRECTQSYVDDEIEASKYHVGDQLVYYYYNKRPDDFILPETTIKGILTEKILCPVSLAVPAFIFMLFSLSEAKRFGSTARRFKKQFIFSAAGCAAITVYTVIKLFVQKPIHYDFVFLNSEYFFVIDCIFYSLIFIIAEIIIWTRAARKANSDRRSDQNGIYTG